jgi:RNA polymerase sigma-70 factor (ECF subfamily)
VTQQIRNLVCRLGVPNCDIDEVTQDVVIKAWRNLRYFRFDSTFRTWVYTVTCNTVVDYHRRSARRASAETIGIEASDGARVDGVAELVVEHDLRGEIVALLDVLSVAHRTVLVLHAEGFTDREAAQILGLSTKAFSSRLARARMSMRRLLSDRPQEPDQ